MNYLHDSVEECCSCLFRDQGTVDVLMLSSFLRSAYIARVILDVLFSQSWRKETDTNHLGERQGTSLLHSSRQFRECVR
jgi:hypothetical protein